MRQNRSQIRVAFGLAAVLLPATLFAAEEIFAPPSRDEVKARAADWAASRKIPDAAVLERIQAVWSNLPTNAPARQLLDAIIETFRLADVDARRLIDACNLAKNTLAPPDAAPLLKKYEGDEFFTSHLKLYYGRYLAQRNYFDESLAILKAVEPSEVVDPATLLFFRAVCEHQLLQKTEGLLTIERLLERTQQVPDAYAGIAELMKHELTAIETDSLGEVSHKMRDSERRLELGRGGQRVQKVQEEIVATLDELIKKREQQQQPQPNSGGGGSGQNNSNQSNAPADDSILKGATAPGEIDQKDFKKQGAWGALPPAKQAEAKNLINQQFPAHYRQAVEQYFKKLANRRAPNERQP